MTDIIRRADDAIVKICGAAGDGSIAAGEILNRAMALAGYHIMNFDSYPAEIRGFGKSVAHTHISATRVLTPGRRADCLISLDDPHSITELPNLAPGASVIFDDRPAGWHEEDQAVAGWIAPDQHGYGVPLRELSTLATKNAKARNIVALGVLCQLYRLPRGSFEAAIAQRFGKKSEAVRSANVAAFNVGFDYAAQHLVKRDRVDFGERTRPRSEAVVVISGNEAAARACVDARCRLYAGYPITPATKIMEILAKELPRHGGVVVQTEDEISAIGHILGAGFGGSRALTATSGPGLCLMTEFMNLGVMSEIPFVVVDSQRGGPSTGLPTKTEQSDLDLAVFGGAGDSPRPVLAPTDVEECHALTLKAFEVAEAFQTPVVVLLDFFLSNRIEDVDWDDAAADRFGRYEQKLATPGAGAYRRFQLTDDGVSPRAVPGQEGLYFASTGLEHDERGRPDYTAQNHQLMTAKRHRKLERLLAAWPRPEVTGADGELEAGIVAWGSTVGAAREAIATLNGQGRRIGGLFPRLVWPLDAGVFVEFARRCPRLVVAEMNAGGQLANHVERMTHRPLERLCVVGAEPLSTEEIIDALQGALP